ncbi:lipocalin-like domain-containing protein [Rufibacter psychrotolerans]|uniref:lipocalin family protein n=1 Tax=Rufibacter psychrotolerans TaxID=2812556 RepID=UPI0019672622|nr:lipocalin family protein [Rufibacter sp. SYSU D00308]
MKTKIALPAYRLLPIFCLVWLTLFSFACNKKSEGGNSQMISGANSKIWKASKETTASGDKDKLTSDEKQEQIQFFANGNFTQTSQSESANGTWMYDAANKNLSLTYQGNNVSENFQVAELSDDKMKLQAPDGSTLTLEAQ